MKNVIIKDIRIQYNEEQADKIDHIINTISKNYSLFLDMLGTSHLIQSYIYLSLISSKKIASIHFTVYII